MLQKFILSLDELTIPQQPDRRTVQSILTHSSFSTRLHFDGRVRQNRQVHYVLRGAAHYSLTHQEEIV